MSIKLLILPSHKLMLYSGKQILTLLPQSILAQQYSTINHSSLHNNNVHNIHNDNIIALYHYKTVNIYKQTDILQYIQNNNNIKPIISQYFPKKVQVLDLYSTEHENNDRQCIISDKFGDIYKININNNTKNIQNNNNDIKQHENQQAVYTNSNLGIPKYIKHIQLSHLQKQAKYKQYLILGDQQNRIKIYNSLNPHQIISVWFMINMYSIQCHVIHNNIQHNQHNNNNNSYPIIVLLLKYYNKLTLQTNVQLHYFVASPHNLQAQEYPGIKIQTNLNNNNNISMKQCKYFTSISIKTTNKQSHSGNAILLLYLFENKIVYQCYSIQNSKGDHKVSIQSKYNGQLKIQQGNWDYLYAIDTQQQNSVIITYGTDVQMPIDLQIKQQGVNNNKIVSLRQSQHISLNKYEKVIKLQLKAI